MGEILALLDRGETLPATALVVQCLKSFHQAALDNGDWSVGWHLCTLRDPFSRPRFGGNERELETISSYTRAVLDLEERMKKERSREADGGEPAREWQPKAKAKAKAKAQT